MNELINARGENYDATKNPYAGYLMIDKKTQVGFFDSWSGAGSLMEIQLEKDVKLPIKYIYSCLPDGGSGRYGVDEVYGWCGYVWDKGKVLKIHEPRKLKCSHYTN